MKFFIKARPLMACLCLLFSSNYSSACTCGPSPLLSPYSIQSNIVSAHVVRYIENEDNFNYAMELLVSNEFNGSIDKESLLVVGGNGLSCAAYVESFPIGSEWIFQLYVSASGEEIHLGGCHPEMEIVDGFIEGYIRGKACGDDRPSEYCMQEKESMSVEDFDIIQDAYFNGASDGVRACKNNDLKDCPKTRAEFFVEEKMLRLPYVGVYKRQSDTNRQRPRPPIAELNATLELLNGDSGNLLFNLYYIGPVSEVVSEQ